VVQPGQIVSLNKNAGEPKIDDRVVTAIFNSPQGLAANSQGVFVVDSQGGVIYPPGSLNGKRSGLVRFINFSASHATALGVVVPPGEVKIVAGIPAGTRPADVPSTIGDGNQSTSAIIFPTDAAMDAAGNLYIADQGNNRIRKVDAATGIISSLQGSISDGPFGPLATGGATGIALDGSGRLHIADTKNHRVLRQDTAGGAAFSVIADSSKGLNRPRDLTVDGQGRVFVTNAATHQVIRITAPDNALGTAVVVAGQGSQGYSGDGGRAELARLNLPNPGNANNDIQVTDNIITLPDGHLLFADTNNHRIRLLVAAPNQAPELPAASNQTVDEAATLTINFTASDPNNDTLTLSLAGNPAFGAFTDQGNGTATLQLAPGYSDAGSYNLTVTASDGELAASQSFTITVNNVNRAPTATADAINSPINTPDESAVVHLSGSGTDLDNDALAYKWFDGATEIANTAVAEVTLGLGTHSIFLMVTDSNNASTSTPAQTVIIRQQQAPNQPPVAVANSLPVMVEAISAAGAAINLDGSGSNDPDDDALSYSWKDGATEIATTKTASVILAIGTHSITLRVSDGRGGTATSTAQTVEVKEPADYTIFTFAGSGNYGYGGDSGPARDASFKEITALTVDGDGNLLIVDALNRVVRRVSPQGTITALAGNSSNGNIGDGGPANLARFGSPAGVAADHLGNVYIADLTFNRIRKVGLDGKISHFAGDPAGVAGFIGDGGPASAAKLRRPTRLAVDAQGNVYVSDSGNQRVRKIDAVTKIITTVAGNGITGFNGDGVAATSTSLNNPMGLAVDSQGTLYLADASNHRLRKVSNGLITTVAGRGTPGYSGDEGPALEALLNNPAGVGVDASGNLYLADQQNHRVRMVEAATGKITTVTGQGVFGFGGDNGKAKLATIGTPTDLWVSASGRALQLADSGNRRVRKLDKDLVPNNPPVAMANELPETVPATGAGALVHLDGSASSDPDGDPLSYAWTDNGVVISTAAVIDVQLLIGTHTIVLTVSDGRGGVSSTAPQVVTVTASGVSITDVYPGSGRRGDRVSITVLGNGFTSLSQVTLSGSGITELTRFVSSTKLTVTLIIASDASLAPRTLTVTNPGGVTATKPNAFMVRP
jgi:sugar lactone lactonase YvrE